MALIVGGGLMMVFALAADRLGYGSAGSVGIGQILLMGLGLISLLAGTLGKRFTGFYHTSATLLLNTVMLLAVIELGAIVFGRSSFRLRQTQIETLSYYAAQDWAEVYWQEAAHVYDVHYEPFVIWRRVPFSGSTVNIDEAGIRRTPGADCVPGAYKLFAFGGSTMVGWGAPDWGTIPAYLQSGLQESMEKPICVINFGEDGYVSTQSVIQLILELQNGNIPDAVVFYDGVNEVIAAHESNRAGVHVTLSRIASRFDGQEHPLLTWVTGTRTFALVQDVNKLLQAGTRQRSANNGVYSQEKRGLAKSVAATYLSNYAIVRALAASYDFQYDFFLQPHPALDTKRLTVEEEELMARLDPELADLAVLVYRNINQAQPDYPRLWDLSDVFKDEEGLIWIDEVGHISPVGNELVADEILEVILNAGSEVNAKGREGRWQKSPSLF